MYPLQTSTLIPNTNFPERGGQIGCISGYISNPNTTTAASVLIYGINNTGKITRSIAPNGYLVFRSLEFERIMNISTFNLEIVYSQNNDFLLEESQALVGVNNEVNVNISGQLNNINVNITGQTNNINVNLATQSGNIDVSIAASTVILSTDLGTLSKTLEENQTNGTNLLTYNPWGFSTTVSPGIRSSFKLNNNMANVQQSGASGHLAFNFFIYNASTSGAQDTIIVNLYTHLPEGGPSATPVRQFSFTTPLLSAGSTQWITINPNIFWPHNSLVVIPQSQGGTGAGAIVVVNPSLFNQINSHYWNGSAWNSADDGFVGFWQIYNTAPASLPVAVTNPISITTGEMSNTVSSTVTSTNNLVSVPSGKKWTILGVVLSGAATATSPTQALLYFRYPAETSNNFMHPLAYINLSSIASGVEVYGVGGITESSNIPFATNTSVLQWNGFPVLYQGTIIALFSNNFAQFESTSTIMITYIESDI